jgi:hypothetical protein
MRGLAPSHPRLETNGRAALLRGRPLISGPPSISRIAAAATAAGIANCRASLRRSATTVAARWSASSTVRDGPPFASIRYMLRSVLSSLMGTPPFSQVFAQTSCRVPQAAFNRLRISLSRLRYFIEAALGKHRCPRPDTFAAAPRRTRRRTYLWQQSLRLRTRQAE